MTNNRVKVIYVKDYLEVLEKSYKGSFLNSGITLKMAGLISFLKELDPNSTLTFKVRT